MNQMATMPFERERELLLAEHQRGVAYDALRRIHELVPVEVLPGVYAYDAADVDRIIAQPGFFEAEGLAE